MCQDLASDCFMDADRRHTTLGDRGTLFLVAQRAAGAPQVCVSSLPSQSHRVTSGCGGTVGWHYTRATELKSPDLFKELQAN